MGSEGGLRPARSCLRRSCSASARRGRARGIEEVLAGARVVLDEYDGYDAVAARHRIAHRVANTLWMSALSLDSRAQWARHAAGPADRTATAPPCPTWHEQAVRDLHTLSRMVVADADAVSRMAQLVNSRRIEPEGAVVFACLLYLTGREEAAQFWWQFAAGAGNATSARCLCLLHMGHGEQRDAEHWAVQTVELRNGHDDPEVELPRRPAWDSFQAGILALPDGQGASPGSGAAPAPEGSPAAGPGWPGAAPDGLDGVLEAVVGRLEFEGDADFGTIPKPDPGLASELRELAAT
jgi:hypothetical protein